MKRAIMKRATMKPKPARLRAELAVLTACLLLAEVINALTILIYRTRWIELISQWGWILILAVVLYLLLWLPRLLLRAVRGRS